MLTIQCKRRIQLVSLTTTKLLEILNVFLLFLNCHSTLKILTIIFLMCNDNSEFSKIGNTLSDIELRRRVIAIRLVWNRITI